MAIAAKLSVMRVETMDRLAQCMEIRRVVFCEEQGVPFELEQDPYDTQAVHFLALDRAKPVGTVRLVILPEPTPAPSGSVRGGGGVSPRGRFGKLGRMAVVASHRHKGVGRLLAEALHDVARKARLGSILLHAQEQAVGFYERLGYRVEGERFMEAGIPHFAMRLALAMDRSPGLRET